MKNTIENLVYDLDKEQTTYKLLVLLTFIVECSFSVMAGGILIALVNLAVFVIFLEVYTSYHSANMLDIIQVNISYTDLTKALRDESIPERHVNTCREALNV